LTRETCAHRFFRPAGLSTLSRSPRAYALGYILSPLRGCTAEQFTAPANIPEMLELSTSVQYVKGIGPRLAEVLANKGIRTVDDLLHYLPFRYEDRVNPRGISELRAGEMATVIAEVRTSGLFRTRRMPIFQMTAGQGRSRLKCIWFNGTYLRDRFKPGQLVALYGKVEQERSGGELQLVQPQFEILGDASDDAEEGEQKAAA
jgi:ATP-dependent DNA helicase RecG